MRPLVQDLHLLAGSIAYRAFAVLRYLLEHMGRRVTPPARKSSPSPCGQQASAPRGSDSRSHAAGSGSPHARSGNHPGVAWASRPTPPARGRKISVTFPKPFGRFSANFCLGDGIRFHRLWPGIGPVAGRRSRAGAHDAPGGTQLLRRETMTGRLSQLTHLATVKTATDSQKRSKRCKHSQW
jgi:hypothetical protein